MVIHRHKLKQELDDSRRLCDGRQFICSVCTRGFLASEMIVTCSYVCHRCAADRAIKAYRSNPYRSKIKNIEGRAKKGQILFDLDEDWFKQRWDTQQGLCHYSGVPMVFLTHRGDPFATSVDRMYPERGYLKTNCVLCCAVVNSFKSNLEIDQFRLFIEALHNKQFPVPATEVHAIKAAI